MENVDKIYYNKSIETILPGADINKLPDAVVKMKNGDYTLIEVASPSQTTESQIAKLEEMKEALERKAGKKVGYELDSTMSKDSLAANKKGGGCGNWVGAPC